jgi:type I restriction enzyme S subunit
VRYKFEDISINSIAKKKPTTSDKNTYLGLEHLDSGNLTVTRFGSDVAPIGEKLIMKKGDVLFGKRRAYQKKVAIAPFDGIFSAHGMVLRPKEQVVCRDFFPLFISSDYFLDAAIKISVGSLSPTINWSALKELEFELPSITQQQQLSKILWAATETKNAYKMLLLLTEKLVKSRFVEMFGDSVMNPMGWEMRSFNELFDITSSNRILKSEWRSEGIPFYRVRDMVLLAEKGTVDNEYFVSENFYSGLKDSSGTPNEGDIMISATGTIGKCYVVKQGERFYYKDADVLRFRKKVEVSSDYFVHCLKTPFVWDQITSTMPITTVGHFTIINAKKTKMPLPPLSLQNSFAEFVKQADKSKFEIQRTIDALEATYKSILRENLG